MVQMPSLLLTLTMGAHDPERLADFWAGLLGRPIADDPRGVLLPGSETQVGLRFAHSAKVKTGPNQVHLHLTSTGPTGQHDTIVSAIELGASPIDVGQLSEEGHVVLADPEGNEFCVIEPHNSYLSGCGFLGELACDGTRRVGLFWAEVLGWPLVWDQDEETAVQSRHGGTKVAWGGPPLAPKHGRNRQRFDLTVTDCDAALEVDRLLALGAIRLGANADGSMALADPDGNEFCLALS